MRTAFFLFLVLFAVFRISEFVLSLLNLRHLERTGKKVPLGFEGSVDPEKLGRIRDYTLAKGRVGLVESVMSDALVLWFFFGGLLNAYNGWVGGLELPGPLTGVLFFLLLAYAGSFIGLPFGYYTTFKVEQKFGFNRQTVSLWLMDFCKSMAISTVLLGLLLTAVFLIIDFFPQAWWLIVWLFFCCFNVLMLYLFPYIIEPLFNKFSPIGDTELENRLKELMARAGLHISRVFTMDASRRSGHSNAYFSGIGKVKRIVLFDTLLASHSREEIAAILAHEAGHWKKKHIIARLLLGWGLAFLVCFLLFEASRTTWLLDAFSIGDDNLPARLILAGFVISLLRLPFSPLASWYSRRHEEEADSFAVDLLGDSSPLAGALVKLGSENLANLHPHPLYAAVHYSHPPLPKRVQALLARNLEKRHAG
jgi:STE24 endopeptidase